MAVIGGVNLGNLTDYLFVFTDGSTDANWQGATKGFIGDVGVDGIQASERTSGDVPYAGTMYTNDNTFGAWQAILNQNVGQATGVTNEVARINNLETDLVSALQQINALAPTPGYESVSSTSLDGLNTQNGVNETFVINITSGLNFSSQINITGDAGDVFILRWDTDPATPGYQGQVKPQSGGAIVPHGGLTPANFINVAGDINASGGGSTPPPPYPQGPRYDDGQGALINGGSDFSGGGFFTGYWLTTGSPDILDPGSGLYYGETSPLSNGIFVGGWYTLTTKFSMTSGTSGVYVSPNVVDQPSIDVEKEVSPDNGTTWFDADSAPGPNVLIGTDPQFRFTVTNNGNVTLTNVQVTDDVYGPIATIPSLASGESQQYTITRPWALGQQVNTATAQGSYDGQTVTDTDPAYWFGSEAAIDVVKEVSPDNGTTWFDANTPTGPFVPMGTDPEFRFTVTNTGTVTLTNVVLNDNVYGLITASPIPSLAPGDSQQFTITGTWAAGQHVNVVTAEGTYDGQTVTDTDPAYWFGVGQPAIDVEKNVSVDNGVTWFDADTPPGPNLPIGTDPMFQYVVTNTGETPLDNLTLTDSVLGPLTPPVSVLYPGDSYEVEATGTWQLGPQSNVAVATGSFEGQTVTDEDPANWVGVNAQIDVVKYVSPDNGVTWFDANAAPGPFVPTGTDPQFRFVVTNTGNVTLTNVQVTDDVYGPIGSLPSLAPGASFEWIITRPWQPGQQVNVATAVGTFEGTTVTDTDPAYWFGAEPQINVIKYVSPDNGVTWFDANTPTGPFVPTGTNPQFRFVVTNTGNVTLTNVQVIDNVYGPIGSLPSLAPGASFEWIITRPWQPGQQVNVATAVGTFEGTTLTDTDPAYWFGVEAQIDVIKYVSPDNGVTWFDANAAPGPSVPSGTDPQFRFVVTNTGNVTLTDIEVTDDVYGPIGTLPSLAPGASFQWIITRPWEPGQHVNVATAEGTVDGITVTDTDPAYWFGFGPAIDVEKYVSVDCGNTYVDADTPPGPTLYKCNKQPKFKYVVTNIGTVPLTNLTLVDSDFGPLMPPVTILNPGESYTVFKTGTWAPGQQSNLATATGTYEGVTVADSDPAYYYGLTPGIPVFPDISGPAPQNEIIDRLLETVALEELSLAALINAEAEKIQAVACAGVMGPVSAEQLAAINRSVQEVVEAAAAKEDKLRRKLERILHHKENPSC